MSNPYKTFYGPRGNTVLFKAQNQRSAIDIKPILYSYRLNEKRDEYSYSGRIGINIWSDKNYAQQKQGEDNQGSNYAQAYIPKGEAKVIFGSILNGTFSKLFPDGHKIFGGSTVEGNLQSRVLSLGFSNGRFEIGIDVMQGRRTKQGAVTPAGQPFTKVMTMLQPVQAVEMAQEVMDFIRAAEIITLQQGLPLHTMDNIEHNPPNFDFDDGSGGSRAPQAQSLSPEQAIKQPVDLEKMTNEEFKAYHQELKKKYIASREEADKRTKAFYEEQNN